MQHAKKQLAYTDALFTLDFICYSLISSLLLGPGRHAPAEQLTQLGWAMALESV
jgi:hypothetical protein